MQWISGLLIIASITISLHGYGVEKSITFALIYCLSIVGLIFCIRNILVLGLARSTCYLRESLFGISIADFLLFSGICLFVLESISSIAREPLIAGDALAYWYAKAKFLYTWEELRVFPTLSYPNLGSAIWMLGMNFSDGAEHVGRSFFPIIIASIFIAQWSLLKKEFPVKSRVLLTLSLLLVYFFINTITNKFGGEFTYVYSGYMDWMVGALPAMAYIFLIVELFKGNRGRVDCCYYKFNLIRLSLLFFIIACAALVKMEGYVLSIIYISSYLGLAFIINKENFIYNKWNIFIAILVAVFISSLYMQTIFFNGIEFELAQKFEFPGVQVCFERIPIIIEYFVKQAYRDIEVILPFIIATIILFRLKEDFIIVAIFTPVILYYGFMTITYTLTTATLDWHLATSFERLFFQISYMYVFGGMLFFFVGFSSIYKK